MAKLQLSPTARCRLLEIFLCALSAELYSYTEGPEFLLNRKCFEEDFRIHGKTILLEHLTPLGRDRDLLKETGGIDALMLRQKA